MKYNKLHVVCTLTDRCKGRNCAFCSTNAKAQGADFFGKNEWLLLDQLDDFDGRFQMCITGGGEPLLARNFYRFIHNLFCCRNFCGLSVVTSGATPKDIKEWRRLTSVFNESFARHIIPCLSFHEFGNGFKERFHETLKYILTSTKVKEVSVKLVHGPNIGQTYRKLYEAFNDVLYAICEEKNSDAYCLHHLKLDYDERLEEFLRSEWLKEKIQNFSMANLKEITAHVMMFECEYLFFQDGKEDEAIKISVKPQKISGLFGRGKTFRDAFKEESPCAIFDNAHPWEKKERARLCVGTDGYFYPACSCPKGGIMHIGRAGEGTLEEKIKQGDEFFQLMQSVMHSRREEFIDQYPCDACAEEWVKILQY